jgi:dTDP-4-amino-4,6-dideoxygalactose transaminase
MDDIIPFVDLRTQYRTIRDEVRAAMDEVLESSQFILGNAVERFECDFATYLGVRHAVGVASGLDALRLALEGAGVGPGDEVVLPANTYIATALAVSAVGAKPVLVDCQEDSYQLDPSLVEAAITSRTRALMPVHLYGQPADMSTLLTIAARHGLDVIEDAAQAHGAAFAGRLCGTMGRAGCFSFYPGKNLGAYGDGGCVVTNDDELAARLRQLRNYGERVKYEHVRRGTNSRLDALQAAVLGVKLKHLDRWNTQRAAHAAYYSEGLANLGLVLPTLDRGCTNVIHLYVVRTAHRNALQRHLESRGVRTGIHYPIPIHLQEAYGDLGCPKGSLPVTERLAGEILSLPMFPELSRRDLDRVIETIASFTRP